MSRTWKDAIKGEEKRLAALDLKFRTAMAQEKARNEVLTALVSGNLKAKQVSGNVYSGKAGNMSRAIRFNIEEVIRLRAESLLES